MPRANDGRKPVGTAKCDCGLNAEFFQYQRGKHFGWLYRKCLNCKPDMGKEPAKQFAWLEQMQRTPYPMIPHPLEQGSAPVEPQEPAREPEGEPGEGETPAPVENTEGPGKPGGKANGVIGVALLVGSVLFATLT